MWQVIIIIIYIQCIFLLFSHSYKKNVYLVHECTLGLLWFCLHHHVYNHLIILSIAQKVLHIWGDENWTIGWESRRAKPDYQRAAIYIQKNYYDLLLLFKCYTIISLAMLPYALSTEPAWVVGLTPGSALVWNTAIIHAFMTGWWPKTPSFTFPQAKILVDIGWVIEK